VARRSADAWIAAALRRLVRDGVTGVRIDRLADDLGVTKGSFYWHFADRGAFLRAIATSWADEQVPSHLGAGDALVAPTPRDRLRRVLERFAGEGIGRTAHAMRDWGRQDAHVRRAVDRADRVVLAELTQIFADLGMSAGEAALRARVIFWAGIGWHVVEPSPAAASVRDLDQVLDLFIGPRPPPRVRKAPGRRK
jgi:AcrR family transcriptional regulator